MMKKRTVIIIILFCVACQNTNHKDLQEIFKDLCVENRCSNSEVIHEIEIEEVGKYGIIRASDADTQYLFYTYIDYETKLSKVIITGEGRLNSSGIQLFENESKEFGHPFNYYVYMIKGDVKNVNYGVEKLKIHTTTSTLNEKKVTISSFVVKLHSEEELDVEKLVIKLK